MYCFALIVATVFAFSDARGVFYAFSADGIDIINPANLTVETRIAHNTNILGTNEVLCTATRKTKCGWGKAALVEGKYVFVADSQGNRLIIIDIKRNKPIKAIKTDKYPYQVTYIEALDEVWVYCWREGYLNVIGTDSNQTKIHKISDPIAMEVTHRFRVKEDDFEEQMMHGYLRTENCQRQNPKLVYGIVSHLYEPGIHKLNLRRKLKTKFINTSTKGCTSTFGLAYSSVTNYAFVQCLSFSGSTGKMMIIDLTNDAVLPVSNSITAGVTGIPYASPDGKYVVVIHENKIASYYMKDRQTPIKRFNDIKIELPNKVAFQKKDDGFVAYITLKGAKKILTLDFTDGKEPTIGYVGGVGLAADLSKVLTKERVNLYKKFFLMQIAKVAEPFSSEKFKRFARKMVLNHVRRPIATSCDPSDRYIASPAAAEGKVAILSNGKLVGLVPNVKQANNILWVK